MEKTYRILGIDPGTRFLGWGIIEKQSLVSSKFRYLDGGVLKLGNGPMPPRLLKIEEKLTELILKIKPQAIVIESIFHHKNSQSALKLGYARGVLLLLSAKYNLKCFEHAPTEIKKIITGYGRADKVEVQNRVKNILKIPQEVQLPLDQSDAMAIALCHTLLPPKL